MYPSHAPVLARHPQGSPARPAWQRFLARRRPPQPSLPPFGLDLALQKLEPEYLSAGSTGEPVRKLQIALKALGYLSGAADGLYGESTAAAVETVQRLLGLKPTGVYTPETWYGITAWTAELMVPPLSDAPGRPA